MSLKLWTRIIKDYEAGEQMEMLDLTPEELKDEIREYAHSSGMKRFPDGSYKFKCDGMIVEITPQDEKVSVKEEKQKKSKNGDE